jgi:hypothetical protein
MSDDVQRLLSDLEAAVIAATGRIGGMGLRVEEVEVDVQTTLSRKAGGEIDFKVVKLGGGIGSESVHTVTVTFVPSSAAPAAGLDDDVVDALEVIERAMNAISERFSLSSAVVDISFTTSADGKISVVIGGEATKGETHVARLKLAPT